jgi:hypothetical protein
MVNKVHTMRGRVVKVEGAKGNDPVVTAEGGLVVAHAVAQHLRLWSDARHELPERKDPTQGYETVAVVGSLVHGLLSGGCGFSATEPMRGDRPLLKALGLEQAPSAETVEEVVKYLALESGGQEALGRLIHRFVRRSIKLSKHRDIRSCEGFVPLWVDGSLLEICGKKFDSVKVIEEKRGQLCVGGFLGPWLTAIDFALEGEKEETLGRILLESALREVVGSSRLKKDVLVLLDSLFGDGPTFDLVEGFRGIAGYPPRRIGVQGVAFV